MKKSSCPRDFYGTVGGKIPYIAERAGTKKVKGEVIHATSNIVTNPSKKGGYGISKTTLSEKNKIGGVAGEYLYEADPFGRLYQLQLDESLANRKKRVTEVPFKPSSPSKKGGFGWVKTNIGNNSNGICGEYSYKMQGQGRPLSAQSQHQLSNPFKPTNYTKSGMDATFQHFPLYQADPEAAKLRQQQQIRQMEKDRITSANPWKPSAIPKKDMIKSVVKMNI
eukprot:TRINITY_DN5033_c0_g1_i11.p2 TRINITY_DN5033_c0_g1~~TRINITY_DN5033_c0_g1_i11.p2  ORF type:complete len:223 (-),score=34.28 TRINITY_DN5033_c0_g1_i11:168-836(-)